MGLKGRGQLEVGGGCGGRREADGVTKSFKMPGHCLITRALIGCGDESDGTGVTFLLVDISTIREVDRPLSMWIDTRWMNCLCISTIVYAIGSSIVALCARPSPVSWSALGPSQVITITWLISKKVRGSYLDVALSQLRNPRCSLHDPITVTLIAPRGSEAGQYLSRRDEVPSERSSLHHHGLRSALTHRVIVRGGALYAPRRRSFWRIICREWPWVTVFSFSVACEI